MNLLVTTTDGSTFYIRGGEASYEKVMDTWLAGRGFIRIKAHARKANIFTRHITHLMLINERQTSRVSWELVD